MALETLFDELDFMVKWGKLCKAQIVLNLFNFVEIPRREVRERTNCCQPENGFVLMLLETQVHVP